MLRPTIMFSDTGLLPEEFLRPDSEYKPDRSFSYKRNVLLKNIVEVSEFHALMPAIREALKTKPALSEMTSSFAVQAALVEIFCAFKGMIRNKSSEALTEHSLRVAQGCSSILGLAKIPFQEKALTVTEALLHDVTEDSKREESHICAHFGTNIAWGVARLSIPNDTEVLHKVYNQRAKIDPSLSNTPDHVDLKFVYKYFYQSALFTPRELLIKSVDTIDKPGSDAGDFYAGEIKLGQGDYITIADIRERNEKRSSYIKLYLQKLSEPASIEHYGSDKVSIIKEEIQNTFARATTAMEKSAAKHPQSSKSNGRFHNTRRETIKSALFTRRGPCKQQKSLG